jgi:hypothetical protein
MKLHTLRYVLLSTLASSMFAATATGTLPEMDESQATEAEMAALNEATEVMISRITEELDRHIDRMGSELFAEILSREIPTASSRPPTQVQPVASLSHLDAGQTSTAPAPSPVLHCVVTPNRPMTCRVPRSRSR